MAGRLRNKVQLPTGSSVILVARPAGYPLNLRCGEMLLPEWVVLLRDAFRYLRFRLRYEGRWTVHVLRASESRTVALTADQRLIASFPVPNRSAAKDRIVELSALLAASGVEGLPFGEAEQTESQKDT